MTLNEKIIGKTVNSLNNEDINKGEVLLSVNNIKTYFPIYGGLFKRKIGEVKAVDDVSFNLYKGETLAIVGESGCGKTTVANTILNLIDITSGEIVLKNIKIIDGIKQKKFTKKIRKEIQIVFQDPDSSLNPRMKIVNIIGEPLRILEGVHGRGKIRAKVLKLLKTVAMKYEHLDRFPHEFSGGQKQRIVIAKALACNPEIIVLDEPTSALDVSVQAQILNLLRALQIKLDLSFIFITHDLSVVRNIADRVAVMYLGKIIEIGPVEEIFTNPSHPYTKALLSARPTFDPETKKERIILKGEIPSPINPPTGCAFHPRCYEKNYHSCNTDEPVKIKISESHYIWCKPFLAEEKNYEIIKEEKKINYTHHKWTLFKKV